MRIAAIINPAAGRGGAASAWLSIRKHLKDNIETFETARPQHASDLTKQAIKRGAETIIAVGGDGTINEVVNGFFEHGALISDRVSLAIVPHGTGSDFIKMLQLPQDSRTAATMIDSGHARAIDLLSVRYTTRDGASALRYSINITSFGMGAAVASRVNRSSKFFGRKLSYVLALVRTAMTFGGHSVSLSIDNARPIEAKITSVVVGNGKYQGAGMLACPRAIIDDGLLDVTLIEFLRLPELLRNLPLLYDGQIYEHPKVQFIRASSLRADSPEPVEVELDGEPLGHLPVEISTVPRVLRVLGGLTL